MISLILASDIIFNIIVFFNNISNIIFADHWILSLYSLIIILLN